MPTLADLFDPAALADAIDGGYVRVQRHPTLPLRVLNYTEKAAYENVWTDVTLACRGLIAADDGRIVARPLPKFFNYGQPGGPSLDPTAPVHVTDKYDGSLGVIFPDGDGGWAVATRGSFASDQAVHATAVLRSRYAGFIPPDGLTVLVEIIYPANRVVCLEGKTSVSVWGGGAITMREIVDHNADPLLIGMDSDGHLVPTRVTQRMNNGRRNDWHAVTVSSRVHRSSSTNVLRMTGDHRVLADGIWVKAADLRSGQKLISSVERPSESVLHLVRASLLGGGCLVPATRPEEAWFREGHATSRGDGSYGKAVHRWLGPCATKLTGPDGFDIAQTSPFKAFGDLRRTWYPSGIKIVPSELDWIDDFAIAKWYMDDGCLVPHSSGREAARFATNCFTFEAVERLGIELNERYGVTCHITRTPSGPVLNVSQGRLGRGNCINRMWEAIAPHVHPSMRYKLPSAYRELPYREYPVGTRELVIEEAAVVGVEALDSRRACDAWSRTAYDITTEAGNFFARNTLVHNCDYGDLDDLVLLGAVDTASGRTFGPEAVPDWPGPVVPRFDHATLAEALAAPPRAGAEGVVVWFPDTDVRVKIKYEEYVRLHRIVTGLNARVVWEVLAAGGSETDAIADLPDEFHDWVRAVARELTATVEARAAEVETAFDAIVAGLPEGWVRRDFAMVATTHPDRGALFLRLDGRDYRPQLWQQARPTSDSAPAGAFGGPSQSADATPAATAAAREE